MFGRRGHFIKRVGLVLTSHLMDKLEIYFPITHNNLWLRVVAAYVHFLKYLLI
jgi:hypothetical protein